MCATGVWRAWVVAAGDPASAYELAAPPPAQGPRAHRLMAWRAFTACRRTGEANALAGQLGIR